MIHSQRYIRRGGDFPRSPCTTRMVVACQRGSWAQGHHGIGAQRNTLALILAAALHILESRA